MFSSPSSPAAYNSSAPVPAEPDDSVTPASDLRRARAALLAAELADSVSEKYVTAHRAALQGAAAVFRLRGRGVRRLGQPVQMWHLLAVLAPELGEWAGFFELLHPRVAAVSAGARVGQRQADDLLRDAETFLDDVDAMLNDHARGDAPQHVGMRFRAGTRQETWAQQGPVGA